MAQGACYRTNTGCASISFDKSPSSISQTLFWMHGTRALTQVVLAYLIVSGTFCFPGITSSTVSPGLLYKYPGRVPKGTLSCGMVRASCSAGGAVARESCLRDFWLSCAQPRSHSQRETWFFCRPPHPMGSLTARVLRSGRSIPLRVSTLSSSFVRPCLGSRVHSLSSSSQQSPVPWLRLTLSATPKCFPIQTKGMSTSLTRLFGVHDRRTLTRSHTLSLSLCLVTPLGGYQTNCPNGCRMSPGLQPTARTRTSVQLFGPRSLGLAPHRSSAHGSPFLEMTEYS